MSDRVFFPFMFLVGCLLTFLAISPFSTRLPTGAFSAAGRENVRDMTVKGMDLHRMAGGPVGTIYPIGEGENLTLEIALEEKDAYNEPLYGPYLTLEADIENIYSDKKLRVIITARTANTKPAVEFQTAYVSDAGTDSGWKTYVLSQDFQEYAFEYHTPPTGLNVGYDYIAIRPVAETKERRVEIQSIRLQMLN